MTKTKTYKGGAQKKSLGVISHAPGSVGECEGMHIHILKWALILGVRVSMNF
jgi:hypothetical protein